MSQPIDRMSVTPTVARQTQKNEFGSVLKDTLQNAASISGAIGGSLVGALPGGPILSAAVSAVTNLASRGTGGASSAMSAASGIQTVGQPGAATAGGGVELGGAGGSAGFNDMLRTMRSEADRSMLQQMQMQQESREYQTVSNVLKVRHDSAKAAINNIR